jgi:hypothetical protein
MHPEGWKPFHETLRSPLNLTLLAIAVAVTVDYASGLHVMRALVELKLQLLGHHKGAESIRLITVFGTFTSVQSWTVFVSKGLAGVCYVVPAFSMMLGVIRSIRGI